MAADCGQPRSDWCTDARWLPSGGGHEPVGRRSGAVRRSHARGDSPAHAGRHSRGRAASSRGSTTARTRPTPIATAANRDRACSGISSAISGCRCAARLTSATSSATSRRRRRSVLGRFWCELDEGAQLSRWPRRAESRCSTILRRPRAVCSPNSAHERRSAVAGLRSLHCVPVPVGAAVRVAVGADGRVAAPRGLRGRRWLGGFGALSAALALPARLRRRRPGASSRDEFRGAREAFVRMGDDRTVADLAEPDLGIETRADLDPCVRLGLAQAQAYRDRPQRRSRGRAAGARSGATAIGRGHLGRDLP